MNVCQEYEDLLSLHATGALEPEQAARVRAHLESCAGCRSEAESTASLLAELALPPPSPVAREKLEALPQRALSGWRRAQVRKALRARNVGALLAAAAAVLLVLSPSLRRSTVSPPAPLTEAPATLSEAEADFEQWASADPLGELLEPALTEDEAEEWDEDTGMDLPAGELF